MSTLEKINEKLPLGYEIVEALDGGYIVYYTGIQIGGQIDYSVGAGTAIFDTIEDCLTEINAHKADWNVKTNADR